MNLNNHPPESFWCEHHAEDVEGEPSILAYGYDAVCEDCSYHYTECDDCGEYVHDNEISSIDYRYVCDACYREYPTCDHCGDAFAGSDYGDSYITLCESCYDDAYYRCESCGELCNVDSEPCCYEDEYDDPGGSYRDVHSSLLTGVTRPGTTFGVEVETLFRDRCPFALGGYASRTLAGPEFISGWRAEEDCTVDAEIISPPLSGPEGLAEIIHTFSILENAGARMGSAAGQHVTVGMPFGTYADMYIQKLMYAMEESMFALTGAYHRMYNRAYSSRMKYSYDLDMGRQEYERECVAHIRDSERVEFRYPPGTLNSSQIAINVGVTQLIARLSDELSRHEIDELYEESKRIEQSNLPKHERIHEQVQLGLMVLADYGWHVSGQMDGLPYDPTRETVARIQDFAHNHDEYVELPDRSSIVARIQRQLGNFYQRMAADCSITTAYAEKLASEAMSIVGERIEVAA